MKLSYQVKLHPDKKYIGKQLINCFGSLSSCSKIFLLTMGILFTVSSSIAQSIYPSTINITGQFGTYKDFQLEISIGESTSITTLSGSAIVLTSGVLQTSVVNQPAANIAGPLSDEIKIYPNPARSVIQVNFVSKVLGLNKYELYDLQGKKILENQFYYFGVPRTETLDLSKLLQGTYILSIQQYDAITNTIAKKGSFKIVKLN